MGFSTAIIGFEKELALGVPELLADLELKARFARRTTGFEALGADYTGWGVALVDGWTMLVSPQFFASDSSHRPDRLFCDAVHYELVKRSRQMTVVAALASSVVDTWGFGLYQGGALRRAHLEQEGRVLIDEGDHTADEERVFAEQRFGEDRAFAMLRAWGVPFDRTFDATFDLYAPDA